MASRLLALAVLSLAARPLGAAGPPSAPSCTDANNVNIDCAISVEYFGGHVISNVKVYAVFWGDQVAIGTKTNIGGFYQAVTNSEWMEAYGEYRTDITVQEGSGKGGPGTGQLIGRGVYAGAFTVTPGGKASCAGTTKDAPLYDSQISAELDAQISARVLPAPDANTIYMIYFPPGCAINDGSPDTPDPMGNSCVDFCAYHSTYQRNGTQSVYYGIMPDYGPVGGCDTGCGGGAEFDNLTSASSHELGEAMSDGEIGLVTGSSTDRPAAWYDNANPSQGEIGDMCNQNTDTIDLADGGSYTVQQMYSQKEFAADAGSGCITTRTEPNDFTVSLDLNSGTLDGGTSISLPVTTAISSGTPGRLSLKLSGLPGGVDGGFDNASPDAGDNVMLTLHAAPGLFAARDAVVVVTAADATDKVAHSAALLLQVNGAPVVLPNDFTLAVQPASRTVTAGQSAAFTILTTAVGTAETIALTASGLPANVTATFNPPSVVAGASSTLTLQTTAAAASGSTPFSIRGTSASVSSGHTLSAEIVLTLAPMVALTAPAAGTISGVVDVTAEATLDASDTVGHIELRDGSTLIGMGTTDVVTISWDTTKVADGAHTLTAKVFDAAGASASSAPVSVNVSNGDFTLALATPAVSVMRGGAPAAVAITTAAVGVASSITLAASGLPAGVTASFSPNPIKAGAASTLTLTAAASAVAGMDSFTITGSNAGLSHDDSEALTIVSPSGCSTSGSPRGLLFALLVVVGFVRRKRR